MMRDDDNSAFVTPDNGPKVVAFIVLGDIFVLIAIISAVIIHALR